MRDYQSQSVYYNRETNSIVTLETKSPNHDSVIVGWDDNYPGKILIWTWQGTAHLSVPTAGERGFW